MNDDAKLALLPDGLHDDLPPAAGHEAATIERLVGCFARHGYERVKPPLVEFEESLLTGPGQSVSRHMFRLMDPITQRMMGVRADMTTQLARIAVTRLKGRPRPLRLCYSGQVLRVRGTQLRPERQFAQAGVELIGADALAADAEMVLLAAEALRGVGIDNLSIDLTVPLLVPTICEGLGFNGEAAEAARRALDRRDGGAVARIPEPAGGLFAALMGAAGPAGEALAKLAALDLPAAAGEAVTRLGDLVALLAQADPDLALTVDPAESRDFEYQTGVSFTLFARGVRGELGRGGRYDLATRETATGFTLYMDSVMRAVPAADAGRRLYLPAGIDRAVGAGLRADGWSTVQGFDEGGSQAARELGCTHIFDNGTVTALD
ncbi:MAG: ATP phosphoribosyltransferase regulatory subunit [Alphaproteobacteria bacterium]